MGSILRTLLVFFYINNIPKIIKTNSKPVLFADDTGLIITNSILINFKNVSPLHLFSATNGLMLIYYFYITKNHIAYFS